MSLSESPLFDLFLTFDQWKDEHDALHARLLEICRFMKWNPSNYEYNDWDAHHRKVREQFLPFIHDWQDHLAKERAMVYPVAKNAICGGRMGPVAVLEQDVRIAAQFFESYQEAVTEGVPVEDALCRLLQVLMVIVEHFRLENETVLPAAERMLDEIDYYGS
jgi:hemerythrin-like domain-containing protein